MKTKMIAPVAQTTTPAPAIHFSKDTRVQAAQQLFELGKIAAVWEGGILDECMNHVDCLLECLENLVESRDLMDKMDAGKSLVNAVTEVAMWLEEHKDLK